MYIMTIIYTIIQAIAFNMIIPLYALFSMFD